MLLGRRKSIKKKTIINVKQKRKSTDETVSAFAENLYKKLLLGISLNEIPFQNSKDMRDLILYILEKPLRNQNDILVIRFFLTNFPGFIQTLNISKNFNDPQEIMQKIAVFLQYEYLPKNHIVCLNGQLGDKFYLIFEGSVAVLVPNYYTVSMTTDDFIKYLNHLFKLKEYDLIHKSISSNRKFLDSSLTKQIIDLEKQCQNIHNLTNYKSEEIDIYSYIHRLIPKESLSDPKDTFPFTLWKYIRVVDLDNGKSFGDVALKDNNSKRTATIITVEDCFFGIIKKDIYQVCIRDTLERIRRFNMETIYTTNLFNDYSKELFKVYIFNNFKNVSISRGKELFNQGDERKEIFFIKSGEFKIELFSSCEELNSIIDSFGGDSYNRDLKHKIELNYKLNNFNKDKKIFSVFLVKRGDILGLEDYLTVNTNNFFLSCKCYSKSAEYFSITLEFFNKIIKDPNIKRNYYELVKTRKQIMIDRLKSLKENTLNHYYSMIKENIFNYKEEEKNPSRNNVKTTTSFKNEDISFLNDLKNKSNTKLSLTSFRKYLIKKTFKKFPINDSQNKSKTRVNNSSEFITKSNTINQSEKRIVLKSSIEPINKFYLSHYDAKSNLNEYKPYLTFGNFNANKKEIPKIKLYNTVINKLISQSDAICTENQQSLHNFDILAMDKYIENAQSERNKNSKCIKYNSNYYDYINSQKIIPINLKIKRNKRLKYY